MFRYFTVSGSPDRPWAADPCHLSKRKRSLFVLLLLVFAGSGEAVSADIESSAYAALVDQLRRHPSVLMSESSAREWAHSADGALGLPNPDITLGINNLPVNEPTRFDRYLPSSRSLEVKQSFPNMSGREALRGSRLARARLAELERMQTLAGLEERLVTALAERRRIIESMVVLDRQLELLLELERWLQGEMEGGGAVYGRFDELDVQRGQIKEKRLALDGEDLRWQAELRQLIDRVPKKVHLPPIEPRSWSGNPEQLLSVQVELGKVDVARAVVKERQTDFGPDFAFSAAWQQRESGDNFDGDDWYTLKFTINVPLWTKSNQTPKLNAAEEAVTRAMAERDQRLREIRGTYDRAQAEYLTAEALLQALQQRSARLGELEASNRRRYEAGEGTLETVIRPALQHIEVELDQARQRARRTVAAARINALLMEEES